MSVKAFWIAWGGLILRFIAVGGSLASLVGLLAIQPAPQYVSGWVIFLRVLAVIFFGLFAILEFYARRGRRAFANRDKDGIKKYMHNWIEHGGRVAIWSRDMSWVRDDDTRELLRDKAKQNELILCLPEHNDLSRELAEAGAEVCSYGKKCLESPASRFTITSFGRVGARLAVGRTEGETHVIEEFVAGGDPAFHLAADLIALVRGQFADRAAR
jgi:hypothetical protein